MPRPVQYAIYIPAALLFAYLTWRFHKELGFLTLSFKPLRHTQSYLLTYFVTTVVAITVNIFFFETLFNAFDAISFEHRKMNPVYIWSMAIPLLTYFAGFYVIVCLSRSIEAERQKLTGASRKNPTLGSGLATCTFAVLYACLRLIHQPALSTLSWLAGLVFFIIYWVRVARNTKQLKLLRERSQQFSFAI